MSVCVDGLFDTRYQKSKGWHYPQACHMMSDIIGPDGLNELEEFAQKLMLDMAWLQSLNTVPHFDLNASKRAKAVKLGAIEIHDYREFSRRCTQPWLAYNKRERETVAG